MKRNRLLLYQIFISVYLLFIILMLAFGIIVYRLTAKTIEGQLANKCSGIAVAVAAMIEQDPAGYRDFSNTLDTGGDYYKRIKRSMEEVRKGNSDNIIYLYTEKKVSDNRMMFVLDGEPEDSPTFSPPGEIDEMTPTRFRGYETEQISAGTFVTTKYGTLLSAYAPIRDDATGEFLGLVGVDVSIAQYQSIMKFLLSILVGSIGIMILMVALALLLSSNRIVKLLTMDSLTGAFNKSFFLRSIKGQSKVSKRKDEPLLVIMADLDHFKSINDTYGHPFGDKVLTSVSKAIKSVLRESDCLARYGGEEFSAYFPGLTTRNARIVLERIRQTVERTKIYNFEHSKDIAVTISIGASYLGMNQTISEVLEDADKALYEAKKTRNAVVFKVRQEDAVT